MVFTAPRLASGKYFAAAVERPVQPPQLFADLSSLMAVLNGSGGVRPQPGGTLSGLDVKRRFAVVLIFHDVNGLFFGEQTPARRNRARNRSWDRDAVRNAASSTLFPGNQTGMTKAGGSELPATLADRIGPGFVQYPLVFLFHATSSGPVSQ
jgi:hypothetical protein